jgi:hypothetical protein
LFKKHLFYRLDFNIIRKQVEKSCFLIYSKLLGLTIFPFLLYLVPLYWLNKQHSICLIKNIFGVECYGCGIARAIISAIQFNFVSAYEYNHLIIIVLPILIYLWVKMIINTIKQIKENLPITNR